MSTLTGTFALALGSTAVDFTVADATGIVVAAPEPGTLLLLGTSVAWLARRPRRAPGHACRPATR